LTAPEFTKRRNLYADPIAIVAVSRGGLGVRVYFKQGKISFR